MDSSRDRFQQQQQPQRYRSPDYIEHSAEPATASARKSDSFRLISRLQHIPGIGIFLATLSGIVFAFSTGMIKFLDKINPFEILFFRSFVQMALYTLLILVKQDNIKGFPGERGWMIAVNLTGFLFLGLAYVAIRMISLGDSSAIIFSSSVYASIFARFLLAEPCGQINILCIAMVISGVILISRPTFLFSSRDLSHSTSDRTVGLILSLVASLSAALTYVMMRKLRKTSSSVAMFWFSFVDGFLSLAVVFTLGQFTVPGTAKEWILLTANGFLGTAGLLLLSLALKLEDAGPVSLARTIDIVVAFIIQITLLHDPAPWTSSVGSVIIISGVAISAMRHFIMNQIPCLLSSSTSKRTSSTPHIVPNPIRGQTTTVKPSLVPTISVTQH